MPDRGEFVTGRMRLRREETSIVHAGRNLGAYPRPVNPPVYRASTILFDKVEAFCRADGEDDKSFVYGRHGTPTSHCLRTAMATLESGYRSALFPSGLAAISCALLAYLKPGDHLLLPNSVYGPTRQVAEQTLARLGISTVFYPPEIGAGIASKITDRTTVIFIESPCSLTFEMQDVPAIADAAKSRGAIVMMDNTWATPLYFKPLLHGVDVSIQAATKYIVGHADAMMGVVTTNEAAWPQLQMVVRNFGQCVGPDDAYLAQRGLRTLAVRLRHQAQTALLLADWLRGRPEVERVMYPPLPSDPGHELWLRDYAGASALFSFTLHAAYSDRVDRLIEGLSLFGLGASWGGYESLLMPVNPNTRPLPVVVPPELRLVRVHAGLEDVRDLISDLEAGFSCLHAGQDVAEQHVDAARLALGAE